MLSLHHHNHSHIHSQTGSTSTTIQIASRHGSHAQLKGMLRKLSHFARRTSHAYARDGILTTCAPVRDASMSRAGTPDPAETPPPRLMPEVWSPTIPGGHPRTMSEVAMSRVRLSLGAMRTPEMQRD